MVGLQFLFLVVFALVSVLNANEQHVATSTTDVTGESITISQEAAVTPKEATEVKKSPEIFDRTSTLLQTGFALFTRARVGDKDALQTLQHGAELATSFGSLYGDDEALVQASYLMVFYGIGAPSTPGNVSAATAIAERTLPFLQRQLRTVKETDKDYAYVVFLLSFIFAEGWGVEANFELALKYIRIAAEANIATAQSTLASYYIQGRGLDKDITTAVDWYRRAAQQGDAFGELYYGLCFYFGHGVDKDLAAALYWFRKSANQGFSEAEYLLGHCYSTGQGLEAPDYLQAIEWYEKAAAQEQREAQFKVGYYYNVGMGGKARDLQKAMYWYKLAADRGHPDAKYFLPAATFIGHVAAIVEQVYPHFASLYDSVFSLFFPQK